MSKETLVHSPLTVEVVVKRPIGYGIWRWEIAFRLIKLAAWVFPFHIRLYRTEEIQDYANLPPG